MSQEEPVIVSAVPAQLPYVPEPLNLRHGPILATVENWSDGTVVARIPLPPIYGEGPSDTLALRDLADNILEYAEAVIEKLKAGAQLSEASVDFWKSLNELVDISLLEQVY